MTNATTNEDTQSTSGAGDFAQRADGAEVTQFKITGINNGTLFKNDGVTQITNGTFITFAEGNAGLKFTPSANFNGNGSFTIQASTSNGDAGLGGSTVNATITVNSVNDAPVVTSATLTVSEGQTVTLSGANFGSAIRMTRVSSIPSAGFRAVTSSSAARWVRRSRFLPART